MDPDRALARCIELAEQVLNGSPHHLEWATLVARAEEFAETLLSLDEWLRNGGFKPTAWRVTGAKETP